MTGAAPVSCQAMHEGFAYEAERQAEHEDAWFLEARRVQVARLMAEIDAASDGGSS